jgi:hypothetical protein
MKYRFAPGDDLAGSSKRHQYSLGKFRKKAMCDLRFCAAVSRMKSAYFIGIIFIIILSGSVFAKDIEHVIQRVDSKPLIDGDLSDAVWLGINPVNEFMDYFPEEGKTPVELTELYIAYDNDFFYLGFKCFDSDIKNLRATLTQREHFDNDDAIGFGFDPFNSEREGYIFNVNPYGVVSDFIFHLGGYSDNGWDADVRSAGKVFSDFWSVEVAVPFKALRMPDIHDQVWGFYAFRIVKRTGEMMVWPPRTHKINNLLAQASLLEGISGVNSGNNFTLIPYVFFSEVKNDKTVNDLEAGFDFKYGISSNLSLDLTVNPDYSQIEADPDRLDLTERYAQWLPEKRPFFTEGTDLFASDHKLFYSRAIQNPSLGMKLSGRFGNTQFAYLSAIDDRSDSNDDVYYNHLRLKTAIFEESSIGFLMTNKDDPGSSASNRCLSMDASLRFRDIYAVSSQVTHSITDQKDGQEEATGYTVKLYRYGENLYSHLLYSNFPDDFDAQSGSLWEDLGYRTLEGNASYTLRKPSASINELEFFTTLKGRYDDSNDLAENYASAGLEMSREAMWSKINIYRNHEEIDGVTFEYTGYGWELWHSPSPYFEYSTSLNFGGAGLYAEQLTGWKYRWVYEMTVKPLIRLVYNAKYSREDFYDRFQGDRVYLQNIFWNKVTLQIIPAMFFRVIHQYNSLDKLSDASVLLTYEYCPLSNVHVGVNFNQFSTVQDMTDHLEIFLKIGYLWRF